MKYIEPKSSRVYHGEGTNSDRHSINCSWKYESNGVTIIVVSLYGSFFPKTVVMDIRKGEERYYCRFKTYRELICEDLSG